MFWKRGFTLLELIVVIIIIGILATLGFTQYSAMMEKARYAEARAILGSLRTFAAAYYLDNESSLDNFDNAAAGIGAEANQIPSACTSTHYFSYAIPPETNSGSNFVADAIRCTSGGKPPDAPVATILTLQSDLASGEDTWTTHE